MKPPSLFLSSPPSLPPSLAPSLNPEGKKERRKKGEERGREGGWEVRKRCVLQIWFIDCGRLHHSGLVVVGVVVVVYTGEGKVEGDRRRRGLPLRVVRLVQKLVEGGQRKRRRTSWWTPVCACRL